MADDHGEERLFEVDPVVVERMETAPGGPVHKVFRHYDPNQDFLIPPSLDDWLDKDHLARFVAELVDEVLDLSSFLASYKEPRGYPPYDPRLMLKVLLYGYVTGVRSSRALERACRDVVAFRWLAANQAPDFRSIARFRRRHLAALRQLFRASLELCQAAGMVRLGLVALDGTKVRANASRRKAMSYRHLSEKAQVLAEEVDKLLKDAEIQDRTSADRRHTTTSKSDADLGKGARSGFGGVLLREPVTWDYADGVGSSKSRSRPGSAMSSLARISA